jgi:hypothetical protein
MGKKSKSNNKGTKSQENNSENISEKRIVKLKINPKDGSVPRIFEKIKFRDIDSEEEQILRPFSLVASSQPTAPVKVSLSRKKNNKHNSLTKFQIALKDSYKDLLEKSSLEIFESAYKELEAALIDHVVNRVYSLDIYVSFIKLGYIFNVEYLNLQEKGTVPPCKIYSLLVNAFKYYNYALAKLKSSDFKWFVKNSLSSKDFTEEEKKGFVEEILQLRDTALIGLISQIIEILNTKGSEDFLTRVKLLNLCMQSLEAKKELEEIIDKQDIGDKETNRKHYKLTVTQIVELKQKFSPKCNEEENEVVIYSELIAYFNKLVKEQAADNLALKLIDEEESKKAKEKPIDNKFIDRNSVEGDFYSEPVIEETAEVEIIASKAELSIGENKLIKARNSYNSNKCDQAIDYYNAAKDYFIETEDISGELNSRIGIADCYSGKASKLVKEFYALRQPFSNQHLLEEAQESLEIAIKEYNEIIINFLANEQITTINFDGNTYCRQDVIELFKKAAAEFYANLIDIDIVIETNIALLEGKIAEWKEFREYKYIEYGVKHYIYLIAKNDPYVKDYIYINPNPKLWDKEHMYEYLIKKTNLTSQDIRNCGIKYWKTNPLYAGLSENDRVSLLQNTETAQNRKALEFYKNLESKNNAIKSEVSFIQEKVSNIFERTEVNIEELTTQLDEACLAYDNPWLNVKNSKIFNNAIQTSEVKEVAQNHPVYEHENSELCALGHTAGHF